MKVKVKVKMKMFVVCPVLKNTKRKGKKEKRESESESENENEHVCRPSRPEKRANRLERAKDHSKAKSAKTSEMKQTSYFAASALSQLVFSYMLAPLARVACYLDAQIHGG